MNNTQKITFVDNTLLEATNGQYISITVNVEDVIESWRASLFSFQWLSSEGTIKTLEELSEDEKPKREAAEEKIEKGVPIEKPILGIGMQENVEIGSGRAEFLTLAAHGIKSIPVHIPKSNQDDFEKYLVPDG